MWLKKFFFLLFFFDIHLIWPMNMMMMFKCIHVIFYFARVHFVAYFNHVIYTHVGGVIDIIIVNKQANKLTNRHVHTHTQEKNPSINIWFETNQFNHPGVSILVFFCSVLFCFVVQLLLLLFHIAIQFHT